MTPLTEGEKAKRPLNLEEEMEYLRVSRVTMLKLFQTGKSPEGRQGVANDHSRS